MCQLLVYPSTLLVTLHVHFFDTGYTLYFLPRIFYSMASCNFCPLLSSTPDCLSYDLIVDAVLQVVSFIDAKCDSGKLENISWRKAGNH